MKRCPTCQSIYTDNTLKFCLQDGASLSIILDEPSSLNYVAAPQRRTDAPTEILYSGSEPTVQAPALVQTVPGQPRSTVRIQEAALTSPPRSTSRIVGLTVVATLILLGLGGVVAWVLLKEKSASVTQNPTSGNEAQQSASAESRSPTSTPSGTVNNNLQISQPPKALTRATPVDTSTASGKWFIILGSYPRAESNKANERLNFIRERGYDARIVDSDNYPNLKGGLWVVVMGPFARNDAEGLKNKMRSIVPDAYAKSGW